MVSNDSILFGIELEIGREYNNFTNACSNYTTGGESMENLILKLNRVKMGLSQEEFSSILHMPISNYSNLENNKREPKLKEMLEISKIINKSIDELFM